MKKLTKREVKEVISAFWELNASRAPIKAFEDIFDCENVEIILAGTDIAFKGIAGFAGSILVRLDLSVGYCILRFYAPQPHLSQRLMTMLKKWGMSCFAHDFDRPAPSRQAVRPETPTSPALS